MTWPDLPCFPSGFPAGCGYFPSATGVSPQTPTSDGFKAAAYYDSVMNPQPTTVTTASITPTTTTLTVMNPQPTAVTTASITPTTPTLKGEVTEDMLPYHLQAERLAAGTYYDSALAGAVTMSGAGPDQRGQQPIQVTAAAHSRADHINSSPMLRTTASHKGTGPPPPPPQPPAGGSATLVPRAHGRILGGSRGHRRGLCASRLPTTFLIPRHCEPESRMSNNNEELSEKLTTRVFA
ncbi:hypothetical protein GWK47_001365 [Chionoecetes opilio]|uniref:Uncharacterized protein n=1 Tax=Chionoecetes opilio TaxID=41210 RepID=A0A8J4XWX0_CHIOP|nr:hypothetical protein GWK47_001365 [Chionoecetes opilio]